MDNQDDCLNIIRQTVLLKEKGVQPILVHGGGKRINRALEASGIKPIFKQGLRVTSNAAMVIISKVLGQETNEYVADLVRQCGGTPIAGQESRVLKSVPWEAETSAEREVREKDNKSAEPLSKELSLGRVGRVVQVAPIKSIEDNMQGIPIGIPIIAPIAQDINSGLDYNINADWAASEIAAQLQANSLVYVTDQDGILDAEGSVIAKINCDDITKMINAGTIKDGMIPKALSMKYALQNGVQQIIIVNGNKLNAMNQALAGEKIGTRIVSSTKYPA